jgi:DNA repair exonuclease SbcCD ATPase subunit
MTSTPAYSLPVDPAEQPILDHVLEIRDHLLLMKQDKSTYVKSGDVVTWYFKLIEEVEQLNRVRENKRNEQNRLDTVLDDCFQLISLFFLTIGRNSEAPAIYSAVSTVKRILDHLKEAAHYSPKDLNGLSGQIEQWQKSIDRAKEAHSDALLTLLQARIDVCKDQLKELKAAISSMDEQTMAHWDKLVSILRLLSACNCRSKVRQVPVCRGSSDN